MKRTIFFILAILSVSCFAETSFSSYKDVMSRSCDHAIPDTDPGFCDSFNKVAICHCLETVPAPGCQNANQIYDRMTAKSAFGTQEAACAYQKDVPYQECMDDWNCYRKGGQDSAGGLCSGTGKSCQ